ncbi:PorP/SprF family type IX secretion system membrane protein [Phaeocystidibacter luteus]|uniref:Type IX secretion system membrane protein PorP/SprF n=1 Tax=Phaeocystidibacter luteus TaxID=911197 RepID=A0A6N6RLQ4_9FLAO|nr:PorP/SprF family type IX secretion system membrane protein [Phaeocystidibacter luteus]KAB2814505.1 type IX secretion system membrane protein PorP/SprF [Phaeocystidibacter luteus]
MEQLRSYVKSALLVLAVCAAYSAEAQDPAFSLFNINQLYLNPAFTGGKGDLSVGLNSRAQWTRVPSRFQTNMAYIQGGCPNWNLGLGLRLFDDTEGEGYMRNTNVAGLVAVHLPGRFGRSLRATRNKKYILSFGLQLAVGQRRLNWDDLVFSDQLDPYLGMYVNQSQVNPQNEVSNFVFDMGVGTRFRFAFGNRGSYASMGVAAFHINQPVESFFNMETRLLPRYTGYFYTHFQTSKFTNNPHYLSIGWVMDHQQVLRTNTLNMNYDVMSNLMMGIAYRKKHVFMVDNDYDSFILSFMYTIGNLTLGYSYDFTLPNLGLENTAGTHEIGIIYNFKGTSFCKKGARRARSIDCYDLDLKRADRSNWSIWRP